MDLGSRQPGTNSPSVRTDPYRLPAGHDLDQLIHVHVMGMSSGDVPPYSRDEKAARGVLNRLRQLTKATVVTGRTSMRDRKWFARYETDPSDGTEVVAETQPLAICRLAMIHIARNADS